MYSQLLLQNVRGLEEPLSTPLVMAWGVVVYNRDMRKHISPTKVARIVSMHTQGFSKGVICIETKLSSKAVQAILDINFDPEIEQLAMILPSKTSKYDHLFEEPRAKGKMYKDYNNELL